MAPLWVQRAVAVVLSQPVAQKFRYKAAAFAGALYWSCAWLQHFIPGSVLKWADATFSTASAYYTEQQPLFAAAAEGYELYWPFAQTTGIDSLDISDTEIITLRFLAWAKMFRELGRDDFRVEKDKCEMYRFFRRAALPHERILRSWNSTGAFVRDVTDMQFFDGVADWPLFLKSCHLTQGSAASVRRLHSRSWVAEHKEDLSQWVVDKFAFRADDIYRGWRDVANALTNDLVPGFVAQAPTKLTYDDSLGGWQPWEMKVDVIWGRAYTAGLVTTEPDEAFFLRSPTGGVEYHRSTGIWSLAYLGRLVPRSMQPSYAQTILNGRHLELCVFPLAERLAKLLRIDHVRVDIFIRGDDPTHCLVNEISLSSGHPMGSHSIYIPKLWAEPFLHKSFEVYGNATSKPAYMLTATDALGTRHKIRPLPAVHPSAWVPFWQAAGLAVALSSAAALLAWATGFVRCRLGGKLRLGGKVRPL